MDEISRPRKAIYQILLRVCQELGCLEHVWRDIRAAMQNLSLALYVGALVFAEKVTFIQEVDTQRLLWIPAFAGMTDRNA